MNSMPNIQPYGWDTRYRGSTNYIIVVSVKKIIVVIEKQSCKI